MKNLTYKFVFGSIWVGEASIGLTESVEAAWSVLFLLITLSVDPNWKFDEAEASLDTPLMHNASSSWFDDKEPLLTEFLGGSSIGVSRDVLRLSCAILFPFIYFLEIHLF